MDSNQSNIQEYYEEVKDLYSIDIKHFEKICRTPFLFVKGVMSAGLLVDIRLQYFGVFKVSKNKLKYYKENLIAKFARGDISEEKYNKKMEIFND